MLDFQKIEREYNYYKAIEQEINLITDLVNENQEFFNLKNGFDRIKAARLKLEKLVAVDKQIKDAANGSQVIITPSLEEMKSKRESIFKNVYRNHEKAKQLLGRYKDIDPEIQAFLNF